jgi:hypothetical protein
LGLTSANDAPDRDPSSFVLSGSNDGGVTFTEIASGDIPAFGARFERRTVSFDNSTAYTTYQLIFPTTAGPSTCCMQIAEIELLGTAAEPKSEPGLVAHFPLDSDGDSSDGAFKASTVADVTFGAAGANGATGTSASFNGSSSMIQHDWSADLNPEGSFTLALWARSDGGAGAWNSPVTSRHDLYNEGEASQGYLIYDNNPSGVWTFWSGNGDVAGNWQILDGPAVNIGEWDHLAIVYDSEAEMKKLYVNGELEVESNDIVAPNDTTPLNIGAGADFGGTFWFEGDIDDIGLWNLALSQEEIQDVMNNGVAPAGADALKEPTIVDFGDLSGDASYEFHFNAVKAGASTAIAGNDAFAFKLDQWNEQGVFGTTVFGVADNVFTPLDGKSVASVFDRDVHVVLVNDTAAGETRLYVDGDHVGVLDGNFELAGEGKVMGARINANTDPMGEGSVMHKWAVYNSALSAAEIADLAAAVGGGGGDAPALSIVNNGDGTVTVTFEGRLEAAASVNGPWQDTGATSPLVTPADAAMQYARAVND